MSSKTPNVDLYKADKITDADQTFNIDTMLNENWDKLDTVIGEIRTEIGEIEPEIPEASTTQKGIVQLDDTTNSTSKGKAATADAVRRVQAAVDTKMEKDRYPNLLMNPTGMLGMLGWKPNGGNTTGWGTNLDTLTGGLFYQNSATGSEYRVLDSNTFMVNAGSTYTLGVNFSGTAAAARIYVEVQTDTNISLNTVVNDGPGYHRKSMQVTIPSGVTSVFVRLGVQPNSPAAQRIFSRLSFVIGSKDNFNLDSEIRAHHTDYTKHSYWGGTSTGDGTNLTNPAYMVNVDGAPISGELPNGFVISFIPNVTNGGGDPIFRVNSCQSYALRRNATTQFANQVLKPGTVYTFVKVGNYFLARSVPPFGAATATQVLSGITFQSEAVPEGGVGTAKADKSGRSSFTYNTNVAVTNNQTYLILPAGINRYAIFISKAYQNQIGSIHYNGTPLRISDGTNSILFPHRSSPYSLERIEIDYQNKTVATVENISSNNSASVSIASLDFSKPFSIISTGSSSCIMDADVFYA